MTGKHWIMGAAVVVMAAGACLGLRPAPAAAQQAVGPVTWTIDPAHSSVVFRVKHLGLNYVYGIFGQVSGTITLDPQNLASTAMQITVKPASVDTKQDGRDKHIRGIDLLNAAAFPEARFVSTRAQTLRTKPGQVFIEGKLTIMGTTHPVGLWFEYGGTAEHPMDKSTRTGLSGQTGIMRSRYGINWGLENNVVGDVVELFIGLQGIKQ